MVCFVVLTTMVAMIFRFDLVEISVVFLVLYVIFVWYSIQSCILIVSLINLFILITNEAKSVKVAVNQIINLFVSLSMLEWRIVRC